ncbi:predicted protein [Nematostella vectensis]|uniref:F-box domain-containing protein n=1 Tax=Nematostella vectensis TaxID=45351 RepID=A7RY44_NEMVE|nr:F-box/LRR-repeat protein 2 [Nematostella vectensis]EDO43574.1 predicted protein [Nematostella vectensis]|eukprot:XP_001635637.1 predicted protein [Nematostella vectensis]
MGHDELKRKISDAIIYTISRALSFNEEQTDEPSANKSLPNCVGTRISELDNPVILKIFSYLSRADLLKAAEVCKRWHELSFDRSLWRNVDLKGYCKTLMQGERITEVTEKYLVSNVVALDLSGFMLTDSILGTLANNCPELRKLVVKSVNFQTQGKEKEVLFPKHLKFLDMRYSHGSLQIYKAITRCLQDIKWLGICDGFILALKCDGSNLSDVLRDLRSIEKLDMSHCKLATDAVLAALSTSERLRVLNLRKCQNIQGEALEVLIPNLQSLETLILDGTSIDDACIAKVPWEQAGLRYLELGWCHFISSDGLSTLFPKVAQMVNLEYLGLCRVGDGRSLTDKNLIQLANHLNYGICTNLNAINFSMCDSITDFGLRAFVRKYPKLSAVDATNCAGVRVFSSEFDSSMPYGRKASLSDTRMDENNDAYTPRRRTGSRGSFSATQFALSKYALETPL